MAETIRCAECGTLLEPSVGGFWIECDDCGWRAPKMAGAC
jgi:DNA-directed RNA polymerase subunit RPC12/RpoP